MNVQPENWFGVGGTLLYYTTNDRAVSLPVKPKKKLQIQKKMNHCNVNTIHLTPKTKTQ